MYPQTRPNYIRRSMIANNRKYRTRKFVPQLSEQQRILRELHASGLSKFACTSMEARYLPYIIHEDEHIVSAVYGYDQSSFAMLIATDWRVIFLDRKPLFVTEDEITYGIISGVNFCHGVFGTVLKLHTRIGDFQLYSFNDKSVEKFALYIESRCLMPNEMSIKS